MSSYILDSPALIGTVVQSSMSYGFISNLHTVRPYSIFFHDQGFTVNIEFVSHDSNLLMGA
ncbi:MAG: hypothetical protein CMJ60_01440 [Planctomycetaceae bacterium]|nr:hypothetical protein [Planctomycetaceae bacterium]